MKNNKILKSARMIAAAVAITLSASAPAVFASVSIDGSNSTTGQNSSNVNRYTLRDRTRVNVTSYASVNNDVDLDVKTGHNTTDNNTTVGNTSTGGVTVVGMVDNDLNSSDGTITVASAPDDSFMFGNDTTGQNSRNVNTANVYRSMMLSLSNNACVDNDFNAYVNTGSNRTNNNTTVGDVMGGSVLLGYSSTNTVNAGSAPVITVGGSSVDVTGENHLTGQNSLNKNNVNVHDTSYVSMSNRANIDNDVDLTAKTGNNNTNNNTTVGQVSSGNVTGDVTLNNTTNSSPSVVVTDNSTDVTGNLSNDTTGQNSNNQNNVNVTNSNTVHVTNNANLNNDIDANFNTGGNHTNNNTTVDGVSSGDVDFTFSVNNTAN